MESKIFRGLSSIALATALAACTRPPPNPPGWEEPPTFHPERSPATLPTTSEPASAVPPALSHVDPDAMGTTRTPLAPAAYPMDSRFPELPK